MKVVLPEPAMPMQTMATGGFCEVVEDAMVERLVVVVVVVVLLRMLLRAGEI